MSASPEKSRSCIPISALVTTTAICRFAAWLGPEIIPLLAPGAIVASDQRLPALRGVPHAAANLGLGEDRYYLYRMSL